MKWVTLVKLWHRREYLRAPGQQLLIQVPDNFENIKTSLKLLQQSFLYFLAFFADIKIRIYKRIKVFTFILELYFRNRVMLCHNLPKTHHGYNINVKMFYS